ncbi:alpha/beta hydrolase family protein [Streptomyces griseus]|uniref:alpha/beta hydrolase family protein n=1 Tax=Streptomyces griseus TaxID=1911 RepID=UPI00083FF2AD|nr:alpha/beta hydrolase [Streptomyces griseus]
MRTQHRTSTPAPDHGTTTEAPTGTTPRPHRARHTLTSVTLVLLAVLTTSPAAAAPAPAPGGNTSFTYPSAERLTTLRPGELLASEPLDTTRTLRDASTRRLRIMYGSQGPHDQPVAVTGFLLTPRGTAPRTGWPVVAWAHGTAGVGPDCAPSLHPNLYPSDYQVYEDLIARLLHDGYAVVGTDYPGLGIPGQLHSYLQIDPERHAVIDSVTAARHSAPELGRQWFAMGHSQGGQAALGAGEAATDRLPALNYLGTIALAPGSNAAEGADILSLPQFRVPFPGWSDAAAYLLYQAVSASRLDPQHISPTDLLSPQLARHLPEAERMCLDQLSTRLARTTDIRTLVDPDWSRNHALQRFYADGEPAQRRSSGPILLLQGTKDLSVTPAATNRLDYELCELGDGVQYRLYPGADHDTLPLRAYPDIARWMSDRLAGRQAPDTCPPQPTTAARTLAATGTPPALPWITALGITGLTLGITLVALTRRRGTHR